MKKIKIRFPDNSSKEFESGIAVSEVAKSIGPKLFKDALAAKVNDSLVDLSKELDSDASLEILTFNSPEGKKIYWHSTSHLMAQAVQELFPQVKLGIGPSIDEGFYYDFDNPSPFTLEDLEKIEEKMKELIQKDFPFKRKEVSKEEAEKIFKSRNEKYKLELLAELEDSQISLYQDGDFIDLCKGPHLSTIGKIKAFKLITVAGAYWRGSEKNPMLQRIYGISFPSQKELDDYLFRLEELKKRDHRKLGKELDLFGIYEEAGAGLVIWHPKGALIRNIIESFWREEHYKAGYDLLFSPHIAKLDLWKKSGHTDFYTDYMYSPIEVEDEKYQIRPMNCPFHILVYKSRIRSYRDLPLKWAELGTVYRYERSGVLQGLMRVRGFTQDDAHLFCRPDQVEEEVIGLLDFTLFLLRTFGFKEYQIYLSTRPEKAIGEISSWEKAEKALAQALEKHKLEYDKDIGGGAFYGPKIDLKIKDLMGRPWQCTTIQFDFNLPERFDLHFVDKDGSLQRPVMVHRALLGAMERFFGVLIEHYGGYFPLWLAPVQIKVMPITDEQREFAVQVTHRLKENGLRVELDDRNEKINFKIREAESEKIPYMLIIGKREVEKNLVALRKHKEGDKGEKNLDELILELKKEVEEKR